MNEVRRVESEAEEIAAIQSVLARHTPPDFVSGFEVTLGTADDEPAAWIVVSTTGPRPTTMAERKRVADLSNQFVRVVRDDLLDTVEGRYPFFRFRDPVPTAATGT